MVQVNVHEAKSQLSKLIEAVLAGESVTIARAGKPVVDLVVHSRQDVRVGLDAWAGFEAEPTIFDGEDPEVAAMFYGGSDA